jgi:hypothetical protein
MMARGASGSVLPKRLSLPLIDIPVWNWPLVAFIRTGRGQTPQNLGQIEPHCVAAGPQRAESVQPAHRVKE